MSKWKLINDSRMGKNDADIQYDVVHHGEWVCSLYFGALGTKDPLYLQKVAALGEIASQMLSALQTRAAIYPWNAPAQAGEGQNEPAGENEDSAKALDIFLAWRNVTGEARKAFHAYQNGGHTFIEGALGSTWMAIPEGKGFRFVDDYLIGDADE